MIEMVGLTDPGRVRAENEDAIGLVPEMGLAILADGMGGHRAGEVASRIAVEVIRDYLAAAAARRAASGAAGAAAAVEEGRLLCESIREANAAIYRTARERPECAGMGTTIVAMLLRGDKVYFAHVGDSRLYRFRAGRLEPLTRDHSVVQELVNRGLLTEPEARATIAKNLVTRALGVEPQVEVDCGEATFQGSDIFLLCSDGLNDVLDDEEIARLLAEEPGRDLAAIAEAMIRSANARGGPDNISVILARSGVPFEHRPAPGGGAACSALS
jgi:protein phosphatase